MKKDVWFPLNFNKKPIHVMISDKNESLRSQITTKKYKVYVKPADALNDVETSRLMDYLILEGFID